MNSQNPKSLAKANGKTLDNVSAMAEAYLREKERGETGAFEKAYNETVGKNPEKVKEEEVERRAIDPRKELFERHFGGRRINEDDAMTLQEWSECVVAMQGNLDFKRYVIARQQALIDQLEAKIEKLEVDARSRGETQEQPNTPRKDWMSRDELLTDTELALYVISQDIPGDAKLALSELRGKLLSDKPIATTHEPNLIVHVDAAVAALHANYDYRIASWHLWKVHRALTGRTW